AFDEIHFHDYLHDIIRSIVPRLKNTKIEIKLVSDGDWSIATYPGAWWQILSSLVENSLTHGFLGKTSGEIVISAQRIEDRLHMVYKDNGHGLTDEAQDKIYEPFYTTAREQGNTGLGMHIVFNLVVQKLEGDISCDSQPDKGVIFRIDVPM
ncbi:MAG: HAMP domain-containing histidine kinase, partial [Psychrosphaera sp.]|nr:HAMP domain-containing histidine kinase [Psychrosphaera sp.]